MFQPRSAAEGHRGPGAGWCSSRTCTAASQRCLASEGCSTGLAGDEARSSWLMRRSANVPSPREWGLVCHRPGGAAAAKPAVCSAWQPRVARATLADDGTRATYCPDRCWGRSENREKKEPLGGRGAALAAARGSLSSRSREHSVREITAVGSTGGTHSRSADIDGPARGAAAELISAPTSPSTTARARETVIDRKAASSCVRGSGDVRRAVSFNGCSTAL